MKLEDLEVNSVIINKANNTAYIIRDVKQSFDPNDRFVVFYPIKYCNMGDRLQTLTSIYLNPTIILAPTSPFLIIKKPNLKLLRLLYVERD
jgi:hypothetical protein